MGRRQRHLSWGEMLGELGVFSLEKERLQGDPTTACQPLKGAAGEPGRDFVSWVCGDGTRSNGFT